MSLPLHEQIRQLTSALAKTPSLDGPARDALADLVKQIAHLNEPHDVSLTDRLEAMAVRFEADHPAVGTALRQAIDALAKAGI
jgi:hypothetical protein